MNRPKKFGQCTYCAEMHPLTSDHIPPKNLFNKPRSSNLITVPCCETCQKGWSKDDEYFRAVILLAEKVYEEPLAQGPIEVFSRSLNRNEQKRFKNSLSSSVDELPIVTKSGLFLGKKPVFHIDERRFDRVAQRIIRGLFFHERGTSLPQDYEIIIDIKQFGLKSILKELSNTDFPEPRTVQEGVFAYTFKETTEDPNSGIWLLCFYNQLPLVGYVTLPLSKRKPSSSILMINTPSQEKE